MNRAGQHSETTTSTSDWEKREWCWTAGQGTTDGVPVIATTATQTQTPCHTAAGERRVQLKHGPVMDTLVEPVECGSVGTMEDRGEATLAGTTS